MVADEVIWQNQALVFRDEYDVASAGVAGERGAHGARYRRPGLHPEPTNR